MRNELTEKDIKKIEEEIEYRKLVVRKEAIEAVKEARAQGAALRHFHVAAGERGDQLFLLFPRRCAGGDFC